MLNAIGLANEGLEWFLEEALPRLARFDAGYGPGEEEGPRDHGGGGSTARLSSPKSVPCCSGKTPRANA